MADPIRPDAVAAVRPLVEHFEGLYLKAYQDEVGVWTIGYGHTSDEGAPLVYEGLTITAQEAEDILTRDLQNNAAAVNHLVQTQINDAMFGALVSFSFNLGAGNLRESTLLARLNAGRLLDAANEFPKWNHAGGKVFAGLTRRRMSEVNFFCSFPNPIVLSQATIARRRIPIGTIKDTGAHGPIRKDQVIRFPKKKQFPRPA